MAFKMAKHGVTPGVTRTIDISGHNINVEKGLVQEIRNYFSNHFIWEHV